MKGKEDYIRYIGKKDYSEISKYYRKADMFLYASTCENMPNILVEAMSAGLPIASSNYGPMPEILKNAGEYFDPLNSEKIAESVEKLLLNPTLRKNLAKDAYECSQK